MEVAVIILPGPSHSSVSSAVAPLPMASWMPLAGLCTVLWVGIYHLPALSHSAMEVQGERATTMALKEGNLGSWTTPIPDLPTAQIIIPAWGPTFSNNTGFSRGPLLQSLRSSCSSFSCSGPVRGRVWEQSLVHFLYSGACVHLWSLPNLPFTAA